MARCPHCHKILPDSFLKTEGARLMGKTSGAIKARSAEQARASSRVRWDRAQPKKEPEKQI